MIMVQYQQIVAGRIVYSKSNFHCTWYVLPLNGILQRKYVLS